MKRIVAVFSLVGMLAASGQLFADLPGGDNLYSALITVNDQNGNRLPGVSVQLWVQTWYGVEWDPEIYNCWKTGVTGSSGTVYLECLIPAELSEGLLFMEASMTDSRYTVISSQNTWSNYETHIYPVFDVGLDSDGNDIVDIWEVPLAEKFCPVLFAPYSDRGDPFGVESRTVRPVPVEIMDRDGPGGHPDGILDYHDVEVSVYNIDGDLVGIYDMEDLEVFGAPYSNRYPDIILPYEQRNTRPPGKAWGSYVLIPQYEWATTNLPENNDVWYSVWEQKMSEQSSNTWYQDGTTYVAFQRNGDIVTINYLFHYPFNASAGRHEGDWPTIRVTVNSQKPNEADINSVSYPIHGIASVRSLKVPYTEQAAEALSTELFHEDGNDNPAFAHKYFVIDQTHPVTFGGGFIIKYDVYGWGSHAQYPCPGTWKRIEALDFSIDEYVVIYGDINNETERFDFNNYQNIKIIPPREYVINHLRENTNYNWLVFGGFWGHYRALPTAGSGVLWIELFDMVIDLLDEILFFTELDIPSVNIAPLSPYKGSLEP